MECCWGQCGIHIDGRWHPCGSPALPLQQMEAAAPDLPCDAVLRVSLYDGDLGAEDEFIGAADVPVADIAAGPRYSPPSLTCASAPFLMSPMPLIPECSARWLRLRHSGVPAPETAVVYIAGHWRPSPGAMARMAAIRSFCENCSLHEPLVCDPELKVAIAGRAVEGWVHQKRQPLFF